MRSKLKLSRSLEFISSFFKEQQVINTINFPITKTGIHLNFPRKTKISPLEPFLFIAKFYHNFWNLYFPHLVNCTFFIYGENPVIEGTGLDFLMDVYFQIN